MSGHTGVCLIVSSYQGFQLSVYGEILPALRSHSRLCAFVETADGPVVSSPLLFHIDLAEIRKMIPAEKRSDCTVVHLGCRSALGFRQLSLDGQLDIAEISERPRPGSICAMCLRHEGASLNCLASTCGKRVCGAFDG
jgi:hypothetical protein